MNNLQKAVIEQLGYETLDEDCLGELQNVAENGADAGFSGFIYYTDTVAFFEANKGAIIEQMKDDVDNIGYGSLIEMIKTFKCAFDSSEDEIGKTLYSGEHDTHVANCLAWYALETVAHQLTEQSDNI